MVATLLLGHLVANESPRQAFYNLWLEVHRSAYRILKESGAGGKVYDKRSWCYESLEAAEKAFERRVRQKTNPARRGRNYRLAGRGKNAKLSLPPGFRVPKSASAGYRRWSMDKRNVQSQTMASVEGDKYCYV